MLLFIWSALIVVLTLALVRDLLGQYRKRKEIQEVTASVQLWGGEHPSNGWMHEPLDGEPRGPSAWDRYLTLASSAVGPANRKNTYKPKSKKVILGLPQGHPLAGNQLPRHAFQNLWQSWDRRGSIADYYRLLGVERHSTTEQIEWAYRRYVNRIHPDKFYGNVKQRSRAQQKLKEVNEAMAVLRDPRRRAEYDETLA